MCVCVYARARAYVHVLARGRMHVQSSEKVIIIIINPLTARVVVFCCVLSSHGESWAKYNLMEPIPLQVENVAVEIIVEPFRPSGPCLRTMKISAQWCRVDARYFTHNLETRIEKMIQY